MAMYYFLGFKLWSSNASVRVKQVQADNTFLLALDGDVAFKPKALSLLVDRMKRNERVGAACGRIHPVGSGESLFPTNSQSLIHSIPLAGPMT